MKTNQEILNTAWDYHVTHFEENGPFSGCTYSGMCFIGCQLPQELRDALIAESRDTTSITHLLEETDFRQELTEVLNDDKGFLYSAQKAFDHATGNYGRCQTPDEEYYYHRKQREQIAHAYRLLAATFGLEVPSA